MCGISGFIDYNKSLSSIDLSRMNNILMHRGPDNSDHYFESFHDFNVGLSHNRLSILDLSHLGNQPMFYNNLIIVFNGEIYNYEEIKQELISSGHTFISNTDTEVILHSFKHWGTEFVHKLIGMFAFVIFDTLTFDIYIYRDRVGVKPLYYYWSDGLFLFGSELKTFSQVPLFKKNINIESLNLFFCQGFIQSPNTIYNFTWKLNPGHFIKFNLIEKSFKEIKYWDVTEFHLKKKLDIDFFEAKNQLKNLFSSAFKYRLVSDVPVAVLLSGGNDSSLVTSVLSSIKDNQINTFTVSFNSLNDESENAKKIADILNVKNKQFICSKDEVEKIILHLPFIFDEPFADSSAIPTLMVCQKIKNNNCKVVLSADGGDEIFGGYLFYKKFIKLNRLLSKYFSNYLIRKIASLFVSFSMLFISKNNIFLINKFEFLSEILWKGNYTFEYLSKIYLLRKKSLKRIIKEEYLFFNETTNEFNNDTSENLLIVDIKKYLEGDILTKVDRSSMYNSIESREPLLDHRIIEYVAQLPTKYKYDDNKSKIIMKNILEECLPNDIVNSPKKGFSVNLDEMFRGDLKYILLNVLNEKRLSKVPYLKIKEVLSLRNYFLKTGKSFENLYRIFVFVLWYDKWILEAARESE